MLFLPLFIAQKIGIFHSYTKHGKFDCVGSKKLTNKDSDRKSDRQTDRHTDVQRNRYFKWDRDTSFLYKTRQIDRQIVRHTYRCTKKERETLNGTGIYYSYTKQGQTVHRREAVDD